MNAPVKIAAGQIHKQMVLVMRDLEAIGKDKNNTQQNFKYRGIDDVYNAIHPILSKHGVFMGAEVVAKTREERTTKSGGVLAFTCLHMRYRFMAEDGSYVETEAEGEGMDSGDKSSNKAMAVAHKYALLQAFCIPTQDMDDPDAQVHEVAAKMTKTAPPATAQAQRQDDDIEQGVRNWTAQRKAEIAEFTRLPELYQWRDTHDSALSRLKSKHQAAYAGLMLVYQDKIETIGNKETA